MRLLALALAFVSGWLFHDWDATRAGFGWPWVGCVMAAVPLAVAIWLVRR